MSKLMGSDEQATVWSVPSINAASERALTHSDASLSAREKKVIEEKVAKLRERARQEGFEQGRREGLARGQAELEQMTQNLQSLLESLQAPLQQAEEQLEDELVKLAVAIARQIVRRELKTDPGQVVALVREALSILPSSARDVRVYLSPDDAGLVRKVIPAGGPDRSWEIVDDPVLGQGSCRVESDTATVDATFESRIAAIAAEILGSERAGD